MYAQMKKYIELIKGELMLPSLSLMKNAQWRHPMRMIKGIIRHFHQDSLYRNSIYLMLSTFIMAFFGFFFWIITARLYTPEMVGAATTLISAIVLLSNISSLGLNVGIIRFLPKAEKKNEIINSSFTATTLTTVFITLFFLLYLHVLSPKILFLKDNLWHMASFIFFVNAFTFNTLAESIFTAFRSSKYILFKNILLSITKVILPIFFVTYSVYGIYSAIGIAQFVAFIISIIFLKSFFKYHLKPSINLKLIKMMANYSFGNFIATFLNTFPTLFLPILVTNKLGINEAGYFYIAMMIANLVFIIPISITQATFAEASFDEEFFIVYIKKAFKIISITLLPILVLILIFGNYILYAFGYEYSLNALNLLRLLVLSSIFLSISNFFNIYLKLKNKITWLIIMNLLSAVSVLSMSYLMLEHGLTGIGLGWLIGQAFIVMCYIFAYRINLF